MVEVEVEVEEEAVPSLPHTKSIGRREGGVASEGGIVSGSGVLGAANFCRLNLGTSAYLTFSVSSDEDEEVFLDRPFF